MTVSAMDVYADMVSNSTTVKIQVKAKALESIFRRLDEPISNHKNDVVYFSSVLAMASKSHDCDVTQLYTAMIICRSMVLQVRETPFVIERTTNYNCKCPDILYSYKHK